MPIHKKMGDNKCWKGGLISSQWPGHNHAFIPDMIVQGLDDRALVMTFVMMQAMRMMSWRALQVLFRSCAQAASQAAVQGLVLRPGPSLSKRGKTELMHSRDHTIIDWRPKPSVLFTVDLGFSAIPHYKPTNNQALEACPTSARVALCRMQLLSLFNLGQTAMTATHLPSEPHTIQDI